MLYQAKNADSAQITIAMYLSSVENRHVVVRGINIDLFSRARETSVSGKPADIADVSMTADFLRLVSNSK